MSIVFIMCCFAPVIFTADAGLVETYIWSKDMYESGFKGVYLYYTGNVGNYEDKIYFSRNTTADARVVSKYKVYNIKNKKRACGFTAGMNITVIETSESQDNKFGFVFGLAYSGAAAETRNSAFVYFTENDGDIYLGLNKYDSAGRAENCISPMLIKDKTVTGRQNTFRLGVVVEENGGIRIFIDDNLLVEKSDANIAFDGYMGLAQTDVNVWQADNFVATGTSNYVPSTINVAENFDGNAFNVNAIYSYAYINYEDDCYLKPVNGVLEFKNVSTAFVSTMYVYSNYELAFDITDIQRVAEYDEDYNVVKPISNKIGVSLYSEDYNIVTNKGISLEFCPENSSNVSEASGTKAVILKDGEPLYEVSLSDKFNLWNKDFTGKVFNVKIILTDGEVTLFIKSSEETGYEKALTYDFGNASQGYIKIYASGTSKAMAVKSDLSEDSVCNFSIDNLSVKNDDYDNSANIYIDYKSSAVRSSVNYEYTDKWDKGDLLFGGGKN